MKESELERQIEREQERESEEETATQTDRKIDKITGYYLLMLKSGNTANAISQTRRMLI